MIGITREITKEEYEMVKKAHEGTDDKEFYYVPDRLESKFFDAADLYGYGVYGSRVFKKDDKYFLHYGRGETCD